MGIAGTLINADKTRPLREAFDRARSTELGARVFEQGEKTFDFLSNTRRGGIVTNAVIGGVSGVAAYAMGDSAADATKEAIAQAMPFSGAAMESWSGDGVSAVRSFMTDTAGLGGAAGGAIAGAALGSVVPIIGTGIGGFIGGVVGGFGAQYAADVTLTANPGLVDSAKGCVDVGASFAERAANTLYSCMSVFSSSVALPVLSPEAALAGQPLYQPQAFKLLN